MSKSLNAEPLPNVYPVLPETASYDGEPCNSS